MILNGTPAVLDTFHHIAQWLLDLILLFLSTILARKVHRSVIHSLASTATNPLFNQPNMSMVLIETSAVIDIIYHLSPWIPGPIPLLPSTSLGQKVLRTAIHSHASTSKQALRNQPSMTMMLIETPAVIIIFNHLSQWLLDLILIFQSTLLARKVIRTLIHKLASTATQQLSHHPIAVEYRLIQY